MDFIFNNLYEPNINVLEILISEKLEKKLIGC